MVRTLPAALVALVLVLAGLACSDRTDLAPGATATAPPASVTAARPRPTASATAPAPRPGASLAELLEAARAALPTGMERGLALGRDDAPIKLLVFEDFQCPSCLQYSAAVEPQIIEQYVKAGKVQLIVQNLPILGVESVSAARGSVCAAAQGRFWEYHDLLFTVEAEANQLGHEQRDVGRFSDDRLRQLARELPLDGSTFDSCYQDSASLEQVREQQRAAASNGLRSTPSFTINGLSFGPTVPSTFVGWKNVLDQLLANPPRTGPLPSPTPTPTPPPQSQNHA